VNRRNEFLVGIAVLAAIAAVILGAIFLSDTDVGRSEIIRVARFRSVGRLQPGAPVILRGVKVGSVQVLRLADNRWVEADLRVDRTVELPDRPAVIAVPASLFGEWQAVFVGRDELTDPNITLLLDEAAALGGDILPGADLPDIGELTAQASRIASDVGLITERVQGAIDSSVISDLQLSVRDLRLMADRLNEFANTEAGTLGRITGNTERLTASASSTLARVDSATRDGRLDDIVGSTQRFTSNLDSISTDLREVAAAAHESRESLTRILAVLDSVLTRMEGGRGTLGLLSADSTLYLEATATVSELRSLIADIKANPRKYFRFSVF
jgi:phospholipid/cholesterol/gamma-HCH transport system substrate-binding protein